MYQLNNLKNKTALITGASSGIGYQIALFLAHEGVKVTALARREEKLKELQSHFPDLIHYKVGDLNDPAFIDMLDNEDHFNKDILINNAGLALGKSNFSDSIDQDIETVIQTNMTSAFKIAKRSLSKMLTNGHGDIINITSIASHEAYQGGVVYCATKHALLAFNKALRHETYGMDVRVMAVSPGMVETEFSLVRFKGDAKKAHNVYKDMTSLTPQDIAYQVLHALKCPRHINLDEIIILATDQAGASKVKRGS